MALRSLYLISMLDSMNCNTKPITGSYDDKLNERLCTMVNQLIAMPPAKFKFDVQAVP